MSKTSLSALLPPLRILILGYGHVAQAFLPLLASRSEWLARESGIRPVITGIGSRSRGLYIYSDGINADLLAREQDPLSWLSSAGTRVENFEEFIQAGKRAGASLFVELTTLNPQGHHDVQFRFESAVMDGLPLINMAEFTLPAVGVQSFKAILNSTSTLVLHMIEQGYSLDEAILKAQQIGVAETDPWYDLDGWDAVMKTTILANTLLEGKFTPHMVEREGIRKLTSDEICAAALAGSPYRLVSQAHRKHGVLFAEVRPRRISSDDMLHIGKGTTGVISIETEAMGTITLVEHEPAVMQTAYGVLSDLITIQRQRSI